MVTAEADINTSLTQREATRLALRVISSDPEELIGVLRDLAPADLDVIRAMVKIAQKRARRATRAIVKTL